MKVLITGGEGFLARHLLAYLQTMAGVDTRTLTRADSDLASEKDRLTALFRELQPDRVFHLAGRISGTESDLVRDNQLATTNLLSVVRESAPAARVILSSTAAVYGRGGTAQAPLTEDQPCAPIGHYGITKYASEQAVHEHFQKGGNAVIARISNPVGSHMHPALLCGTLARQIVAIERGKSPVVVLRDLSPQRDFIPVNDCVRAIWQIAESGRSGETYNVASGTSTAVRSIVDTYLSLARVAPIEIQSTAGTGERSSIHEQWLSNARLCALGWSTAQSLLDAIAEHLDAERSQP